MNHDVEIRPKHFTFGALVLTYVGVAVAIYLGALAWASFLTPVTGTPPCGNGFRNLRDMQLDCFSQRWYVWLFELFLWIVLLKPIRYATCIALGKTSRTITKEQRERNFNNSSAIVENGLLAFTAILIAGVDFTTLPNYINSLLLRGSFTAVLGLIFAILAVRIRCNIRSFGEFQEEIFEPGSDSVAIWFANAFILAALLQVL